MLLFWKCADTCSSSRSFMNLVCFFWAWKCAVFKHFLGTVESANKICYWFPFVWLQYHCGCSWYYLVNHLHYSVCCPWKSLVSSTSYISSTPTELEARLLFCLTEVVAENAAICRPIHGFVSIVNTASGFWSPHNKTCDKVII